MIYKHLAHEHKKNHFYLLQFVKKKCDVFKKKRKEMTNSSCSFVYFTIERFVLMNSIGLNPYVCLKKSMPVCIYLSNTKIRPRILNEQNYINTSHRCI